MAPRAPGRTDGPSVRACGHTGILEVVGAVRVCCSPASVVVLPPGARYDFAHGRRGRGRGVRAARGLIRATYRGSVGLFDMLREPLAQPLEADDQIRCSFEEALEELLAQRRGARAMAEALLHRWLVLLFRRWWPAGPHPFWLAVLADHRLGRGDRGHARAAPGGVHGAWLAETAGMSRSVFVAKMLDEVLQKRRSRGSKDASGTDQMRKATALAARFGRDRRAATRGRRPKSASSTTDFFGLLHDLVIELGARLEF